jgi:hypothetical protein
VLVNFQGHVKAARTEGAGHLELGVTVTTGERGIVLVRSNGGRVGGAHLLLGSGRSSALLLEDGIVELLSSLESVSVRYAQLTHLPLGVAKVREDKELACVVPSCRWR